MSTIRAAKTTDELKMTGDSKPFGEPFGRLFGGPFGALLGAMLMSFAGACAGSTYLLPASGESVVGEPVALQVTYDDRFATLAMRYDLGFEELRHANPTVDPWIPGEGARVVLPSQYLLPPGPRQGIVINLPEYRLYYFPKDSGTVVTYPIGIGRTGFQTPAATTKIIAKIVNPSWYPTPAHRKEHLEQGDKLPSVVPPGPDNPLGAPCHSVELAGLFSTWHQQAVWGRPTRQPRLCPALSGRYSRARGRDADWHPGAHHRCTVQGVVE